MVSLSNHEGDALETQHRTRRSIARYCHPRAGGDPDRAAFSAYACARGRGVAVDEGKWAKCIADRDTSTSSVVNAVDPS
jgi:hypothetical protein